MTVEKLDKIVVSDEAAKRLLELLVMFGETTPENLDLVRKARGGTITLEEQEVFRAKLVSLSLRFFHEMLEVEDRLVGKNVELDKQLKEIHDLLPDLEQSDKDLKPKEKT
jgi:hypothetical protein